MDKVWAVFGVNQENGFQTRSLIGVFSTLANAIDAKLKIVHDGFNYVCVIVEPWDIDKIADWYYPW